MFDCLSNNKDCRQLAMVDNELFKPFVSLNLDNVICIPKDLSLLLTNTLCEFFFSFSFFYIIYFINFCLILMWIMENRGKIEKHNFFFFFWVFTEKVQQKGWLRNWDLIRNSTRCSYLFLIF